MKSEHLVKLAAVLGKCGYEITDIESDHRGAGTPITGYQISINLIDPAPVYENRDPAPMGEAVNG
jgi:hypothetical protein